MVPSTYSRTYLMLLIPAQHEYNMINAENSYNVNIHTNQYYLKAF